MGKYYNGINGPFTGKVGRAVGSTWKGIPVLRAAPMKRTKPFSEAELRQQAKFRIMTRLLKMATPLLDLTFRQAAVQMSGFNKAFSYNVKNAITGEYPDLKIDFPMLLMGRGDLPNAGSPLVGCLPAGKLEFSWTDNSGKGKALSTDKAFVAVYIEDGQKWEYDLNLALRSDGACSIDLSEHSGKSVQTYLGFISTDDKDVTDTVYTGAVILPEKNIVLLSNS